MKKALMTRAFYVETSDGRYYRRNRRHLKASNESSHSLPPQCGHNHTAENVGFREKIRQGRSHEVPTSENGTDTTALKNLGRQK